MFCFCWWSKHTVHPAVVVTVARSEKLNSKDYLYLRARVHCFTKERVQKIRSLVLSCCCCCSNKAAAEPTRVSLAVTLMLPDYRLRNGGWRAACCDHTSLLHRQRGRVKFDWLAEKSIMWHRSEVFLIFRNLSVRVCVGGLSCGVDLMLSLLINRIFLQFSWRKLMDI